MGQYQCSYSYLGFGILSAFSGLVVSCQRLLPTPAPLIQDRIPESRLLPQDTAFVMSFFQEGIPEERATLARMQSLVTSSELGIQEQDLPWNVEWLDQSFSVAVVEPNVTADAEDPIPGVVMVAGTQDPQQSQAYLANLRARSADAEFESTTSDNIVITVQTNGELGERLISAEVGEDYVIIANHQEALQAVLATYRQEQGTLADHPTFQETSTTLVDDDTFIYAYVDTDPIVTALEADTSTYDTSTLTALESFKDLEAVSLVIKDTELGVRAHAQIDVDPDGLLKPTSIQPVTGSLVQDVPGSSLLVVSGYNPALGWQDVVTRAETDPVAAAQVTEAREWFQTRTQLDFEDDVISWMDGEFTVSILPGAGSVIPFLPPVSGLLMIETSQREKAEATLAELDNQARQAGLRVEVDEGQVTWSNALFNFTLMTRTWEDNRLMISSNPQILSQLVDNSMAPIATTDPLKTVYATLQSPNYGYAFINWQETVSVLKSTFPNQVNQIEPEAQAAIETITALGLTSYLIDQDSFGLDMLITLSEISETP